MLHLLCICYFTSFYLHIVLIISHLWRSGMRYLLEIIKPLECSSKISEIWASSMSLVFNMLMWSDHFFCVSAVSITLKHLNVLQPVAFTLYYPPLYPIPRPAVTNLLLNFSFLGAKFSFRTGAANSHTQENQTHNSQSM